MGSSLGHTTPSFIKTCQSNPKREIHEGGVVAQWSKTVQGLNLTGGRGFSVSGMHDAQMDEGMDRCDLGAKCFLWAILFSAPLLIWWHTLQCSNTHDYFLKRSTTLCHIHIQQVLMIWVWTQLNIVVKVEYLCALEQACAQPTSLTMK